MRYVIAALIAVGLTASNAASAQEMRGFAVGGVASNSDGAVYPAIGGGATMDVGMPWLSAGGQAEAFFSGPYVAGRGGVFGQANVGLSGGFRLLALGGAGFGEDAGPLIGAGLELHPAGHRLGMRVTLEDYLTTVAKYICSPSSSCAFRSRFGQQLAIRAGVTF